MWCATRRFIDRCILAAAAQVSHRVPAPCFGGLNELCSKGQGGTVRQRLASRAIDALPNTSIAPNHINPRVHRCWVRLIGIQKVSCS